MDHIRQAVHQAVPLSQLERSKDLKARASTLTLVRTSVRVESQGLGFRGSRNNHIIIGDSRVQATSAAMTRTTNSHEAGADTRSMLKTSTSIEGLQVRDC